MTDPVTENGLKSPPVEGEGGETPDKVTSESESSPQKGTNSGTATTTPVPLEPSPEAQQEQQKDEAEQDTQMETAELEVAEKKESSNNTESNDTEASPTTIAIATEEKSSEASSPTDDKTAATDTKAEDTATTNEGGKTEKGDEKAEIKEGDENEKIAEHATSPSAGPVVSASKRTRPPYKYDPEKVTLRFLFANKDGLTVTVECKPGDTVGEVKGQLMSVWPEDLPDCSGGDQLRLICMGKGMLTPDSRTLEDCQVPVFKTHPTPINVSVRPTSFSPEVTKSGKDGGNRGASSTAATSGRTAEQSGQGCECIIL